MLIPTWTKHNRGLLDGMMAEVEGTSGVDGMVGMRMVSESSL